MLKRCNQFKIQSGDFQLLAGNSFGKGDHPTTALCIELMGEYLRPGATMLDVGTGSGILMIAAAKLGVGKMVGFDRHLSAAVDANKNLLRNGVETHRFFVFVGDRIEALKMRFDVVVVNILPEIIRQLLPQIRHVMAAHGTVICSGMIQGSTRRVEEGLKTAGFELVRSHRTRGWVALVGGMA